MFSLRKLESLTPKTRLRKLAALLLEAENALAGGAEAARTAGGRAAVDLSLFASVADSPVVRKTFPPHLLENLDRLSRSLRSAAPDTARIARQLNDLRFGLMRTLGMEAAEWNLEPPELPPGGERSSLPIRCFLEDIRSPFNVGAVFRTAEAFGVEKVMISRDTPLPTNRRAMRTSRGCERRIPWRVGDLADLQDEKNVFALETGGIPLDAFQLPEEGWVLVGSEELGLSPEALRIAARKSGRVSIPMRGAKRSLNVSVAFGILLWEWSRRLAGPADPEAEAPFGRRT